MSIPELIIVGDVELLFVGLSLGLGSPKLAQKMLARRASDDTDEAAEG